MRKFSTVFSIFTVFMLSLSFASDYTLYYGLDTGDSVINKIDFSDVKSKSLDYWAKPAIYQMSALDVISGFSNKTFLPTSELTNEQAITLILKAIGKDSEVNSSKNTTANDTWSDRYIRYAMSNGIITEKITMKKSDLKSTSNIDAMKKAGVFIRDNVITREEVCGMLARALELTSSNNELKFFDASVIDETYKDSVKAVNEAGIMNGTDANMFNPKSGLKREEMAQILVNAEDYTLSKMAVFKKTGIIDSISSSQIEITEEEGEAILIDVSGKNIPVYRNGSLGGKGILKTSDDVCMYFDGNKNVKFIKVINDGVDERENAVETVKSIQGIVTGNSPYFEQITVKDKNGNTNSFSYGAWTKIYKDGKETSASDIISGDTVYIEFDEINDVVSIRAVSNYKISYGTITKINGFNVTIKDDLGVYTTYNLINIPLYKNGAEIKNTDLSNGEYAKLYNTDFALAKLEIVPDERSLENIYKGEISEINLIQDKIVLRNPQVYKNGYWKRYENSFVSITLDKEMDITFYGETIDKDDLGEKHIDKFAYIATREDAKEIEKVKALRIDLEEDEKVYRDNVKSFSGETIKLQDSSNKIYIDDATIFIEDGKIVEQALIEEDDKIYATTVKIGSKNYAAVLEITSNEEVEEIEIYYGTIENIDDNEDVTLCVYYKYIDDDLIDGRERYSSFNITSKTRIVSSSGPVNIRDFSFDENEDLDGMYAYIVAYGDEILTVSLLDEEVESMFIKGEIEKSSNGSITVYELEYYDMEEEEWVEGRKRVINIANDTVLFMGDERVSEDDLEIGQNILVIKAFDDAVSDAKVVIVK